MTIRKATPLDAPILAELMLLAMEDIVFQFIQMRDREEALRFLVHFAERENNIYSYQNCRIIEDNNRVLGMANLYDGSQLYTLRKPIEMYIKRHYNRLFFVEDETQAGEVYLDTFAIHPEMHGKGFGSILLKSVIHEVVYAQAKTLGLLVEPENSNAKKLYVKLGFTKVGKKILLNKPMEHWQIPPV